MINRTLASYVLGGLLCVGVAGGIAYAALPDAAPDARDAAALADMKVTLTQAIATAEQKLGGRAVGADVSRQAGVTQIAVEVVGPQGARTVTVDARTGQITAMAAAGADGETND